MIAGKGTAARVFSEVLRIQTSPYAVVELTGMLREVLRKSGLWEGLLTVYLRHTSASLLIFVNADPTAMRDLCRWLERLAPKGDPQYTHTLEGEDDMPSHLRMVLTRTQETIPFVEGRLVLGSWQGVFLLEHRASSLTRELCVMAVGANQEGQRAALGGG